MTAAERGGLRAAWDRYWFEAPVLRTRLAWFRTLFFGLLAFDLWLLMLERAPRYGAGGFNVSHFPALDPLLPLPTAAAVTVAYLVAGFLALRVALGIGARWSTIGVTVLYGGVYFWSQVDSYQHHYLIALMLLLSCFLPFEQLPGLDRPLAASTSAETTSWASRLLYILVCIVYAFTGFTKTSEAWLDGWAMTQIVTTDGVRDVMAWIANTVGQEQITIYRGAAWSIMLFQFFAAAAFLFGRLRAVACAVGPLFHVMVEVMDLKVGWFSWYMIALYYVLLFPDAWFLALARPVQGLGRTLSGVAALWRPDDLSLNTRMAVGGGAGFICGFIAISTPLAGGTILAVVTGALAVLGAIHVPRGMGRPTLTVAAAHVLMAMAMYGSVVWTDVGFDYHRLWAGDLRRRGEWAEAAEHYEQANRLNRDGRARYRELGEAYEQLGRRADAHAAYQQALNSDPNDARARQGLARTAGP